MKLYAKVAIGTGAVALAGAGALAMTAMSYVTAAGDKTHWSVRFVEQTKAGQWLERRVTAWSIRRHVKNLPAEERADFLRQCSEVQEHLRTGSRKV